MHPQPSKLPGSLSHLRSASHLEHSRLRLCGLHSGSAVQSTTGASATSAESGL